jgi:hypothetical protein
MLVLDAYDASKRGRRLTTTAFHGVYSLDNGANNSNTDFMAVYFELS